MNVFLIAALACFCGRPACEKLFAREMRANCLWPKYWWSGTPKPLQKAGKKETAFLPLNKLRAAAILIKCEDVANTKNKK